MTDDIGAQANIVPVDVGDDPLDTFRFPGIEILGDIMSPIYSDEENEAFFEASAAKLIGLSGDADTPCEPGKDSLDAFYIGGKILGDISSPLYSDEEIKEFSECTAAQLNQSSTDVEDGGAE